jgi:Glycosyltransferase family 28 C-terminal domain
MRRVTIVFFDAGGGHRSAAEALKSTLETQREPWDVSLLNLQELLDSLDVIRRATGIRLQDGYNLILRKGWTRPTPQLLVLLRGLVRMYHSRVVRILEGYWREFPVDLVVSVIPLFNRSLAESIRSTMPQAAFVTLLTDLADCPPHFWMEEESEFLICGTEKAKQQALEMGHHPQRVFETSGMILKPRFYESVSVDRKAERTKLGLDPDLPTGIVLFGGHGSPVMTDIANRLAEFSGRLQLIMICGHNQKLRSELQEIAAGPHTFIEGFTSRMDYYMSLADFFIGKPGPGSISEALQFHLPVMVECNTRTMPQERYNAQWLIEKRMGIVLKSFDDIAAGVTKLLRENTFAELRRNAQAYSNRALFEIPYILEQAIDRHALYPVTFVPAMADLDHIGPGAAWAGTT